MDNGTFKMVGKEVQIHALGRVWTLGRFDFDAWDRLLPWVKERLPDPFAAVDWLLKRFPEIPKDPGHTIAVMFDREFAKARDLAMAPLTLENPRVQAVLDKTVEGQIQRFWELFRVKHPEITKAEVLAIMEEIGEQVAAEALAKSQGLAPKANGDPSGNSLAPVASSR